MGITYTATLGVSSSAGGAIRANPVESGTSEPVVIDTVFSAGSTNVAQTAAFTVANVQACMLLSDQNMTIKTNSAGSPANTLTLVANEPYLWLKSQGIDAFKFTTNVTGFYITCTAAARLQARILST